LRTAGTAAAAGLLVAASLPPWGWWPLGIAGAAVLVATLGGHGWQRRALLGGVFGVAQFIVGLWWMREFTVPGYILCSLLEASFFAAAAAVVHPRRLWTFPAALVLAEAARGHWPLGGLPLGGAALGQVGGPLAPAARLGGELLIVGLVAAAGVAVVLLARRHWRAAAVAVGVIVAAALGGVSAPSGDANGTMRVVAVQGGGVRGYRAVERDPADAFDAQDRATARVRPPLDVLLWPEDVVDVTRLDGSAEAVRLSATARGLGATVVAGVVEDDGATQFRNAVVAWAPSGAIVARYDKVHRVPFGEYIPARGLVRHFGDISAVPRDARPGHGPGILRTPAGRLGVMVSYEVFFADRARSATRAHGRVLLVPTNASSFRTSQVPGQELAAARLRAIETGRTTVQAAPTGYTAVVSHAGDVVLRSGLGRQAIVRSTVVLRRGSTPATRLGPWPVALLALVLLGTARLERLTSKIPVASGLQPG